MVSWLDIDFVDDFEDNDREEALDLEEIFDLADSADTRETMLIPVFDLLLKFGQFLLGEAVPVLCSSGALLVGELVPALCSSDALLPEKHPWGPKLPEAPTLPLANAAKLTLALLVLPVPATPKPGPSAGMMYGEAGCPGPLVAASARPARDAQPVPDRCMNFLRLNSTEPVMIDSFVRANSHSLMSS